MVVVVPTVMVRAAARGRAAAARARVAAAKAAGVTE